MKTSKFEVQTLYNLYSTRELRLYLIGNVSFLLLLARVANDTVSVFILDFVKTSSTYCQYVVFGEKNIKYDIEIEKLTRRFT